MNDKGRKIAVDPSAKSSDASLPAFIARPEGAPVYHGFRVLDDITVEGFTLGMISDFLSEAMDEGDAFVIAPDNSRAGLVWELGSPARIVPMIPIAPSRWGVWTAYFELPMDSKENARKNLASILPNLRTEWEKWQSEFGSADE